MRKSQESETFRGRADSACFWEAWVGAVLGRAGLYTIHHPLTVAADVGRTNDSYAETYDLDVSVGHPHKFGYHAEVEVKSRNLSFTSSSDYPYESITLCSQASFLRKWRSAEKTHRDFLFISRVTGNIVWLPSDSPVTVGHETYDSKRGESYKTVHANKAHLRELSDFVEKVYASGK